MFHRFSELALSCENLPKPQKISAVLRLCFGSDREKISGLINLPLDSQNRSELDTHVITLRCALEDYPKMSDGLGNLSEIYQPCC